MGNSQPTGGGLVYEGGGGGGGGAALKCLAYTVERFIE